MSPHHAPLRDTQPSASGGGSSAPALTHGAHSGVALPCRLGRFDLAVRLAGGGFGEVFLARARGGVEAFSRYVAVKTIHRHLTADPSFVEMFLDEVRVASGLHHPNLCAVVDAGESDGTYFLAMEYVVGEPLTYISRKLARADAPLPRAERLRMSVEIVRQIASGLHAAHESVSADGQPLEIVHRDVAPGNLFVGYDGRVSVLDFGIAQFEGRNTRTNTGTVKGHLAYVAPEQFRGQIDRRVDVWALGVVFHELLAEKRLFARGSDPETMHAVLLDPIPSLPADVPEPLQQLVTSMLARDRDERLASAAEVALRLGAFLGQQPVDLAACLRTLLPKGRDRHQQLFADADRLLRDSPSHTVVRTSTDAPKDGEQSRSRVHSISAARRAPTLALLLMGPVVAAAVALAFFAGRDGAMDTATPGEAVTQNPASSRPVTREPSEERATRAVAPSADEVANVPRADEMAHEAANEPQANEPQANEPENSSVRVGPRRRVAADREPGTLFLSTPGGWANVYDGSRLLGETPGRFQLSAGRHTLRVVPGDGGNARTLTIVIPPGAALQRSVALR